MSSAPTNSAPPTIAQLAAVTARGNVLVMAGAGTGKTKTLVDRCLHCLTHDGANVDELLVVTFTEAAAAELRLRLRRAIEAQTVAPPKATADFWPTQLARFELAHIGTLHSFCLKLIREHFHELQLDPRLAILDDAAAHQLATETLEEIFAAHYAEENDFSAAVRQLIRTHGNGRDDALRTLILRLHHYSQARPDAAGWLAEQRARFATATSADWPGWFAEAIEDWRQEWLPVLENLRSDNVKAAELAVLLKSGKSDAEMLAAIIAADANWPRGKKTILREPFIDLFAEAEFLQSLLPTPSGTDPLAEDWSWVRAHMATLLGLAEEFSARLAVRKREAGALDFHDLEQFALRLLRETPAIAESWREKLRFIFVDEYQDINAAQDEIIARLSRTAPGNRFLVGDVKQSIYRFRLADPRIFRRYAEDWGTTGKASIAAAQTLSLAENFRSRESLLGLVNAICRRIFCTEVGGVAYDTEAELKFGAAKMRADFSRAQDKVPTAELLLRLKTNRAANTEEPEGLAELNDAQREARLVANRLQALVTAATQIFDDTQKAFRPLQWRDIAILLRAPGGKAELFVKEFQRAGIPLAVARGGFFASAEIMDLLSLLELLDNPLQDVPCIAVLRSPLVGLSLDELAEIRLAASEKHFWTALNHWSQRTDQTDKKSTSATERVAIFLQRYSRWRRLAKQVSLSQCLEEILAETLYADWLRAQPSGTPRAANVAGLLQLAQRFDQFQRQGLFRFLKFVRAQQEAEVEPEVPAAPAENAVRLMSIHQSKGLEFPVVVLPDLAKRFNQQDLHAEIIFDEHFGLCPKVAPPGRGGRYPSLPHWLAQRRQQRGLRGEELRLLYVALTRARDQLILTASVTGKNWAEQWNQALPITPRNIGGGSSFADWLALWFADATETERPGGTQGCRRAVDDPEVMLHWRFVDEAGLLIEPVQAEAKKNSPPLVIDETANVLATRLNWSYPAQAATKAKAKRSVTELRRAVQDSTEEAAPIFSRQRATPVMSLRPRDSSLSAAEIGLAHHTFLQHVALEKTNDLTSEVNRLVNENYLSAAEGAALDLAALAAFWDSPQGSEVRAHAAEVRRELAFTARFSPAEISALTDQSPTTNGAEEFVVVQGVADLVVLRTQEIWLLDFKTDAVTADGLPEKVRTYTPQLSLYAAALEKIFSRPVTRRALCFLAARKWITV